jgi:hypothetical protein
MLFLSIALFGLWLTVNCVILGYVWNWLDDHLNFPAYFGCSMGFFVVLAGANAQLLAEFAR